MIVATRPEPTVRPPSRIANGVSKKQFKKVTFRKCNEIELPLWENEILFIEKDER